MLFVVMFLAKKMMYWLFITKLNRNIHSNVRDLAKKKKTQFLCYYSGTEANSGGTQRLADTETIFCTV